MIHTPFKYGPATKRPLAIIGGDAGFTLAELVIAMGIMAIVVVAVLWKSRVNAPQGRQIQHRSRIRCRE
jgi:prepilin-type N-terminal cleavage/methylation domain-containing protein